MTAHQNEEQLRIILNRAIDNFELYCTTQPFTPNYLPQHHKSIQYHNRDANKIEFSFLGQDFVIIKEMRPIIGQGYLKTYRKKQNLSTPTGIEAVFIPELLIVTDTFGNMLLDNVTSMSIDKRYFDKLEDYLNLYETSTPIG